MRDQAANYDGEGRERAANNDGIKHIRDGEDNVVFDDGGHIMASRVSCSLFPLKDLSPSRKAYYRGPRM